MRFKRFGLVAAALALVVGIFGNIGLAPNAYAVAKTWTGAGGNTNFSTAANWSDNSAPVDGDSLSFNVSSLSASVTLTNDIADLSVVGITFLGTASQYYYYTIAGSAITVAGAITNTATKDSYILSQVITAPIILGADSSVTDVELQGTITTAGYVLTASSAAPCGVSISGAISGTGSVEVNSGVESGVTFMGNNSGFTGSFVANPSANIGFLGVTALGGATSLTSTDARVVIGLGDQNRTLATSLNLSGKLTVVRHQGAAVPCVGGIDSDLAKYTLTTTGGLSLNGDLEYYGYFANTVVSEPYAANAHTLSVKSGSDGVITLPTGTLEVQPVTTTYSDNVPADYLSASNMQTIVLDGTRAGVSVSNGGVLKGVGTMANSLNIWTGGVVAPGHSPGCLTSDTLVLYGTYQFELGGSTPCTQYDQLKVLNGAGASIAVDISATTAVLSTSRFNGYTPKQGDVFVIIDQAGAAAVVGTFKDLAEGATFEQNGIVFKISYVGGSGNDVTLTVQNVPTAPNTGFELVKTNPLVFAAVALAATLMLIVLGRKLGTQKR